MQDRRSIRIGYDNVDVAATEAKIIVGHIPNYSTMRSRTLALFPVRARNIARPIKDSTRWLTKPDVITAHRLITD
jgi:hypothetical protein